jgi:hypothetical protein
LARFGVGEYDHDQGMDTVGQEAFGAVIDTGSNMVKAFQDFEGGPCVDHRLSNALKDALEKSKICEIVWYCERCAHQCCAELNAVQSSSVVQVQFSSKLNCLNSFQTELSEKID